MFLFHKNQRADENQNIEEVMQEVSDELHIKPDAQKTNQDPKALAERLKKEIKKRTRQQ